MATVTEIAPHINTPHSYNHASESSGAGPPSFTLHDSQDGGLRSVQHTLSLPWGVSCVGSVQATVYDDTHLAGHVGVALHFVNQRTEYTGGGSLRACAWLSGRAGLPCHTHGDICLVRNDIHLPGCPSRLTPLLAPITDYNKMHPPE